MCGHKEKICDECNNTFEYKGGYQKFCSVECRDKKNGIVKHKKILKKCLICSKSFTSVSINNVYCGKVCSLEARYKQNSLRKDNGIIGTKRSCTWCKNEFTVKNNSHIFCSRRCNIDNNNKERRVKRENRKKEYLICKKCGKKFERRGGKKFCTKLCQKLQWSEDREEILKNRVIIPKGKPNDNYKKYGSRGNINYPGYTTLNKDK